MGYDGYGYEERNKYAESETPDGFAEYGGWLKEYDEYAAPEPPAVSEYGDAFVGYDEYEERNKYAESEALDEFAEYDGGFTEYGGWLKEYGEYAEGEEFAEYGEKAAAEPPIVPKPPVAAKPTVKPPVAVKPPAAAKPAKPSVAPKPPVAAKPPAAKPVRPPVVAKPPAAPKPVKPPVAEAAREENAVVRTQSGQFQLGIDIEGGLSDISGFTGGGGVVLENRFSENVGAGAQIIFYADMPNATLITLESTAFAALYFPSVPLYGAAQFYVAADAGAAVYLTDTGTPNPETAFSPTVGGTVGIEFSLSNAFYLDLFVRGGYPLLFSGGVGFGRVF
ncbi:hypothetical protein [Treponema endosymbiont of Eucomonympha sp.]|uniref:hypothetical protein n=1 Tax=Treponema endosymbiont of Eucomonympha sp. TaxID=1580831 RepID=UPI001396B473|nr:hypothetical protein [Treponema endosymbiont of Eucomonympha sp.]